MVGRKIREVLERVPSIFKSRDFISQDADNPNSKDTYDDMTNAKIKEESLSLTVSSIITNMLEYSDHANVQKGGCAALSDLARSEENKTIISHEGGIEVIINAMDNHILNVDVQKYSCKALSSLTHHSDENRVTVPSEGGIQVILRAMKLHSSHTGIQEAACRALYNLACDLGNSESISDEGGINLIVECMKNHVSSFKLQEEACRAIRNLSFGSPSNNKLIPLKGGIEAIIDVMKLPNQRIKTIIEAYKALYNLSSDEDNKNAITRYGGINVITKNMKRPGQPDLYLESFRILYILASDYERKNLISQDGIISIVFMILKNHIDHLQIQIDGYKLHCANDLKIILKTETRYCKKKFRLRPQ